MSLVSVENSAGRVPRSAFTYSCMSCEWGSDGRRAGRGVVGEAAGGAVSGAVGGRLQCIKYTVYHIIILPSLIIIYFGPVWIGKQTTWPKRRMEKNQAQRGPNRPKPGKTSQNATKHRDFLNMKSNLLAGGD